MKLPRTFWLFAGFLLLYAPTLVADYHPLSAVKFVDVAITPLARSSHTGHLYLAISIQASGSLRLQLRLPWKQGRDREIATMVVSGKVGDTIRRSLEIPLPSTGYHQLVSIQALYTPLNSDSTKHYQDIYTHSLYGEVVGSQLSRLGPAPDLRSVQRPRRIFDVEDTKGFRLLAQTSRQCTLHLSGTVAYLDRYGQHTGVPGVRVYFDWDYDNDAGTLNSPPYADGVSWAVTDAEGDFTFDRVTSSLDDSSPFWSTTRLVAFIEMVNDAAYDNDYGNEADFPEHPTVTVSINPTDPNPVIGVSPGAWNSGAEPMNEVYQNSAHALRYFWRAREFAMNSLGFPPLEPAAFYIDHSPDVGDVESNESPNLSHPFSWLMKMFRFNVSVPQTFYHEYGHYAERQWHNPIPNGACSGSHDVWARSNVECAMSEGWAEFFAAATSWYWYSREQPILREDDRGDQGYQFMEKHHTFQNNMGTSQGIAFNTADDEGAIAHFLFNLWDDPRPRGRLTVGFVGDNDDLDDNAPFGHPRPWILYALDHITDAEVISRPVRVQDPVFPTVYHTYYIREKQLLKRYCRNYVGWMRTWYPLTSPYHEWSLDAMYHAFTDRTDSLRPATPTRLTVTGNKNSRTLTWNDTTEPATITYNSTNASDSIPLTRNNESGFTIWRKTTSGAAESGAAIISGQWRDPAIMDGRLDAGFKRIGWIAGGDPLGPNGWTYVDNTLVGTGRYVYVVVANNAFCNSKDSLSIPKAIASILINGNITHKDDDPVCDRFVDLLPGMHETLKAIHSETGTVTRQWITTNKPAYISVLSGADTAQIINLFSGSVGTNPLGFFTPFSIRCVSTVNGVSDTSTPYWPAFAPLDTASRFVRVAATSGLVLDSNVRRGLDFVTHPEEDVISVRPLSVVPKYDSAAGYIILLRGFPIGATHYNEMKLLAIDHPAGTVLGGSAECGFHIYISDSLGLHEDTTRPYGMEEFPVRMAWRGSDTVTPLVKCHDTLRATVEAGDSLFVAFDYPIWDGDTTVMEVVPDSLVTIDSSRIGWVRDYLLELRGTYVNGLGGSSSIQSEPVSGMQAVTDGEGYALEPNTPNPFTRTTTIQYMLGADGPVLMALYDANGQMVRTLVEALLKKGRYELTVDCSDLAVGTYYYRLTAAGWSKTLPLQVVR